MPQHKSCKKRMKTSAKQRIANRQNRSRLRAAVKDLRDLSNKEEATKKYTSVCSLLDKAASSGLIHRSNADRNKSRLAIMVGKLA